MNMVALGRVVLTRREHVIALEPKGRGLLGLTLRYPYEVRDEQTYFEDIPELKLPKDMLDLASHSSKQNQATSIRLISRIDTKTRLLTYSRRNKLGKRLSPFGERPRHAW
jgi:DNA end-binding protein Ku